MTEKMGLPDIMSNMVSKGEIKQAIKCYSRLDFNKSYNTVRKWETDGLNICLTTPTWRTCH